MGFLDRFKKGRRGSTVFSPVKGGYLRLRYDGDGLIETAAFLRTRGSRASGAQLYFDWLNDSVTWKTANGLSGQQWGGGVVRFGTVYDDDSGEPNPGRRISLPAWVDECIAGMVRSA